MTFEFTQYIWPLIVSSFILTALWVFTLRYHREPAARAFLGLLTVLIVWSVGFIFEIMGVELKTKIFWANIQFLGITFVPFLFLTLVIRFTGRGHKLKYFLIILLFLAVITNVIIWTNDLHHLFRQDPWVDKETKSFSILANDYGPWFYYGLALISYVGYFLYLVVLVQAWNSSQKLFRRQIEALLFSLVIPLIVDGLYILEITPIPNFNFTPVAFSISGLLIGWTLFHYRLFDLVPMAYDVIVENLITGVIVLDVQNRVTVMNTSAYRFAAIAPDEAIGKPAKDVLWFWHSLNIEQHEVHSTQIEQKIQETDTTYHYDVMIAPIKSRRRQVVGRLVTIRDTTEHLRLFRETEILAISDPLTDVYNRRYFFQLLQEELDRTQVHRIPLAVMMFDIDNFKHINDQYGHVIGDEILIKITRTCRAHLRKSDSIGRYGGDEFIILLPQTDSNVAIQVAKRLCQSIGELVIDTSDGNISLTISLGVVECGWKDKISIERLTQVVDQALYQAKEKGKNQFVVLPLPNRWTYNQRPVGSEIFLEAKMQEIRVKVNQIELQIREYEQEGDAIIFLHFGGANLMMWQRVIPYFQDHYRLILVDLRGHGKSDRPETGYHMDEMARDVIGIMQHLKLERAHIVGSSLGAEVGLGIAANYPEKVISLVCEGALCSEYGPYGIWQGSETDFEEHVARQLEKLRNTPATVFPSVDALVDNQRKILEKYGWWNKYVEAVERYGACKVGEGKYTKGFGGQAMGNYMEHYFQYRFEDYYRKVKCPLLMLPGEEELENEREKAVMEGLGELAEQGEIVQVSGWVHPYGWLLHPEDVSKAILEFLGDTAH